MGEGKKPRRRAILRWTLAGVVGLLGLGFGALSYLMGGPGDAYGFLRFALPQWRDGDLQVGDPAPDAELAGLDGRTSFRLSERQSGRPLVLIFGSYT